MSSAQLLFWALTALAFTGCLTVLFTRSLTRLALGLGGFFLAVAGFFAWFGFGFLALAELFVYVGGVLVLWLFAIMLVHRPDPGAPVLESRHDLFAGIACAGVFAFGLMMLRPLAPALAPATETGPAALGELLLGAMLPHFLLASVLLLVALVSIVVVVGGESK